MDVEELFNRPSPSHDEPPLSQFMAEAKAVEAAILYALAEHERKYHRPIPRAGSKEWAVLHLN